MLIERNHKTSSITVYSILEDILIYADIQKK